MSDEGTADLEGEWCLSLGKYAESLSRVGKHRRVTREEAEKILRHAEKNGYVHQLSRHYCHRTVHRMGQYAGWRACRIEPKLYGEGRRLDLCRNVAKENDVNHIRAITLSIGELTGYIPYFFTEYFPIITKGEQLFEGTELRINEIKGEALCKECRAMYNVMKTEGKCPKCGSREKTITQNVKR